MRIELERKYTLKMIYGNFSVGSKRLSVGRAEYGDSPSRDSVTVDRLYKEWARTSAGLDNTAVPAFSV